MLAWTNNELTQVFITIRSVPFFYPIRRAGWVDMQEISDPNQGPSTKTGGLRESNGYAFPTACGRGAPESLRHKDWTTEGNVTRSLSFKDQSNMSYSCFGLSVKKKFIINHLWQKVQVELDGLKKELNTLTEKAEEILACPQQASSSPILRSELDVILKKTDHVYSLSSMYLDKWGFLTSLRNADVFSSAAVGFVKMTCMISGWRPLMFWSETPTRLRTC